MWKRVAIRMCCVLVAAISPAAAGGVPEGVQFRLRQNQGLVLGIIHSGKHLSFHIRCGFVDPLL